MTAEASDTDRSHVLAGYDGSPGAANAVEIGARLLPGFAAQVVHLWAPPFASPELRRRLLRRGTSLDELAALIEREGTAEADRVAADGVALARAAGWQAEPLAKRSYGGEGLELARLAEKLRPVAVVVGSRGLSGARAVLGSVSDMVAHYSPVPALVVPHPLSAEERRAAAAGPVVVGYDGSEGARGALAAAASVFAGRELIAAVVADGSASAAGAEAAGAETVVLDADRPAHGARAVADALAGFAAQRRRAHRRWVPRAIGVARDPARKRGDGGAAPRRATRPHRTGRGPLRWAGLTSAAHTSGPRYGLAPILPTS